jgi:hypothetical protein
VKQVSPGPHYGVEARVCAIGTDRVIDKSLEKKMGEVLSAPQWKHPCLSPFLGDGLRDGALYLSIRFDKMRWFQHDNQAIFGTTLGRNPRREVKQVSSGPHYGGEARVCAIGTDRVIDKSLEKKMG